LQTNIPTATIDTVNSRVSDRCPICKRWIPLCDFVIDNFSNFNVKITKSEVRCLDECDKYSKEQIILGKCPYTKYHRGSAKTLEYTNHKFSNNLHYHYKCVLDKLDENMRNKIISAKDKIALKTHYPHYYGLEELINTKKKNLE